MEKGKTGKEVKGLGNEQMRLMNEGEKKGKINGLTS